MKVARPILKYHGGKWRLAPWIIENLPAHKIYVEPFSGAASVLLRKPRSDIEVLNDLNGRLVNVFRVLRNPDTAQKLKELLMMTPCSEMEYFDAREQSDDLVEDARRMIVLGHQGHGGTGVAGGKKSGWRRRSGNGSNDWENIYSHIMTWCDRLRGVYLENSNAFNVIDQWDAESTLFYVDPPYVSSTRHGSGAEGYKHELTDQDHVELAEKLHSVKGSVLLSGYKSELYQNLYKGWKRIERNALADHAKHTVESLWFSPNVKPEFNKKRSGYLF